MEKLALVIGYGFIFMSAVVGVLIVASYATDVCWKQMQKVYSYQMIRTAIRQYKGMKEGE